MNWKREERPAMKRTRTSMIVRAMAATAYTLTVISVIGQLMSPPRAFADFDLEYCLEQATCLFQEPPYWGEAPCCYGEMVEYGCCYGWATYGLDACLDACEEQYLECTGDPEECEDEYGDCQDFCWLDYNSNESWCIQEYLYESSCCDYECSDQGVEENIVPWSCGNSGCY
jgi:hypothetical protein